VSAQEKIKLFTPTEFFFQNGKKIVLLRQEKNKKANNEFKILEIWTLIY